MWVRDHWRSLKVVPFESLGTVFYSPSIVTMAVSAAILEIYSASDNGLTLKSGFGVRQGHWEWRHSIDHGKLLVSHCNYSSILYHLRIIWRLIIRWPWNRGKRSLKVIEIDAIRKLGCGFLFAFYSNYGRIFDHFGDILRQRMTWPWNVRLGFVTNAPGWAVATAGINSNVDVCETAKHHTELFWYKLYKFIFVTALARHIVQQIQQI